MSEHLRDVIQQLDGRIRLLEQIRDPVVRDEMFVILELIDRLHRAGLAELAVRLQSKGLWDETLENEEIALLFRLYDLAALEPDEAGEGEPEAAQPAEASGAAAGAALDGRARRRLPVLKGRGG